MKILLLLLVAVLLAGCGGGSSSSTSNPVDPTPPVTPVDPPAVHNYAPVVISDLYMGRTQFAAGENDGSYYQSIAFNYSGVAYDVSEAVQTVYNSNNTILKTASFHIYEHSPMITSLDIDTRTAGTFRVEIYVIDWQGGRSNMLNLTYQVL